MGVALMVEEGKEPEDIDKKIDKEIADELAKDEERDKETELTDFVDGLYKNRNIVIQKEGKAELEFEETEKEQRKKEKEYKETIAAELLEDIQEEYFDEERDFSVDKLSKTSYLYKIFSGKHDKYKSLFYLRKVHKEMQTNGFPEGAILNQYLFLAVTLRRLQIEYQQDHKARTKTDSPIPENYVLLKEIKDTSERLSRLQITLDSSKAAQRAGQDVHDLHNKEIESCADFVKHNVGEFSFRCKKCKTIVSSGGLPHWAIVSVKTIDKVDYHIWSREIFTLVKEKLIPLYMMAFALQTSIEGLVYTAELRNEQLPEHDIKEEEVKLKELMIDFEEIEFKRQG